jgi:valyl-tRNA synthetase
MHPLMPFLTEELWQRVPKPASRKASVAFGPYPEAEAKRDLEVEAAMETLQGVISAARTVRSEHSIHSHADVPMRVRSADPQTLQFLRGHADAVRFLVKTAGAPVFEAPTAEREKGTTVSVVPNEKAPIEVLVGLRGLVTMEEEIKRIDRELKKNEKELAATEKKLSSPGFVDRAPKDEVEKAQQVKRALVEARERLQSARVLAEEL